MNPYDAPHEASQPQQQPENRPTPRRFRWRIIPAVLSWSFGGIALVGFAVTLVLLERDAQRDFHRDLAMFGSMVCLAVLYIFAGFQWLKGSWLTALFCNVAGYLIVNLPVWLDMM